MSRPMPCSHQSMTLAIRVGRVQICIDFFAHLLSSTYRSDFIIRDRGFGSADADSCHELFLHNRNAPLLVASSSCISGGMFSRGSNPH
jgi:hypothetical protein